MDKTINVKFHGLYDMPKSKGFYNWLGTAVLAAHGKNNIITKPEGKDMIIYGIQNSLADYYKNEFGGVFTIIE